MTVEPMVGVAFIGLMIVAPFLLVYALVKVLMYLDERSSSAENEI